MLINILSNAVCLQDEYHDYFTLACMGMCVCVYVCV